MPTSPTIPTSSCGIWASPMSTSPQSCNPSAASPQIQGTWHIHQLRTSHIGCLPWWSLPQTSSTNQHFLETDFTTSHGANLPTAVLQVSLLAPLRMALSTSGMPKSYAPARESHSCLGPRSTAVPSRRSNSTTQSMISSQPPVQRASFSFTI